MQCLEHLLQHRRSVKVVPPGQCPDKLRMEGCGQQVYVDS